MGWQTCTDRSVYSYDAAEDNELTFREGDRIVEIEAVSEDWWQGRDQHGNVGLFPGGSRVVPCGIRKLSALYISELRGGTRISGRSAFRGEKEGDVDHGIDPQSMYGVATERIACLEITLAVMIAKRRPYGGLTAACTGRKARRVDGRGRGT